VHGLTVPLIQFGLLYTALAPMRSLAEMAGRRLSETSELIEGQYTALDPFTFHLEPDARLEPHVDVLARPARGRR
jgi:hypothetical protein